MKIGDKVRMLKKDRYGWSGCDDYQNEIGIVTEIPTDGTLTVHSEHKEKYFGFFAEDEVELIQKYKVGDRVKIIDPTGGHNWSGNYKEGTIKSKSKTYTGEWLLEELEYNGNRNNLASDKIDFPESCLELIEEIPCTSTTSNTMDDGRQYHYTPSIPSTAFENLYEKFYGAQLISSQTNKPLKEKIMETTKSVVEFAKNMMLTKDEKLLRKANLQDENGNWTDQADMIVKNFVAQELGFKDTNEASRRFDNCGGGLSFIELAQAFTKYQDKLIEIAQEFEKENK